MVLGRAPRPTRTNWHALVRPSRNDNQRPQAVGRQYFAAWFTTHLRRGGVGGRPVLNGSRPRGRVRRDPHA